MRRSFLFMSVGGLCSGIAVAELWPVHGWPMMIVGACGLTMLLVNRWRLVGIFLVVGLLGCWQWTAKTTAGPNDISRFVGQNAIITGTILQPPASPGQQVVVIDALEHNVAGKIQVSVPPFPLYHLGQQLTVECHVEDLALSQRWRQWSHGIHARCFQAEVTAVTTARPSMKITLGQVESGMISFIHRSFNEPQASLLAGIMLGDQIGMPASLTQAFQATGTTHIIALSGFNVTIIVSSVMMVLVRLIGRRWAWLPGLALVVLFVLMTGASASVVRAAIMAVISQLAIFLGRPLHPTRLLSYTAIIMLLENPLILFHDLGFELSFLATIGLIFMSKPLTTRLTWIPERLGVRENLGTTLAAIIATEPLLLWQFGRLSLIAPIVNIIVLPFIPMAMGLGTLCLIGWVVPLVSPAVTAVTDAVLRFVLWCITTAAHWHWSMMYLSSVVTISTGVVFIFLALSLLRLSYVEETHPA